MSEHKLSEQEIQQIREEAEYHYHIVSEDMFDDTFMDYDDYVKERQKLQRTYIAAVTRERERVKGLVEKGELLAEGAQHLFDMKKQKGSTSVMKNAWNILAIRLYDLKEALNNYKNNK